MELLHVSIIFILGLSSVLFSLNVPKGCTASPIQPPSSPPFSISQLNISNALGEHVLAPDAPPYWPPDPFSIALPSTSQSSCEITISGVSPHTGSPAQLSTLLDLLNKQINALRVAPKEKLAPRFVAASDGVTLELTPNALHRLNIELAVGAMTAIMELVLKSEQVRDFWGLVSCARLQMGTFRVELDEENEGGTSSVAFS